MSTLKPKKYGLILSSRKAPPTAKVAKPSVFGDSSSDEEDTSRGWRHVNASLRRENEKKAKQPLEAVAKALEEDPSIFEYDSLYDEMAERKKKADPRLQKKDTKPKYIHSLKRAAERRKLEQEIVYERKAQQEIEREGEVYKDKETYLTSSYRRKLEERKKIEEELKEEEQIEAANDVTKQKDLSKFYRHFFHEQTGPEKATPTRDEQKAPADRRRDSHRERRSPERRRKSTEEEERVREKSPDPKREESSEEEPLEGGESDHNEEMVQERPSSTSAAAASDLPATTETVNLEERRRIVSAKRTNEETFQSAKERYLARKRAKLTDPSS